MLSGPDYELAKYRVKISHFTEQGYEPKGVIHIGAHDGYEVQWYLMMGVAPENILCFEPNTDVWKLFQAKYPDVECVNVAVGIEDGEVELQITEGDGQGTSTLDLLPTDVESWQYTIIDKRMVPIRRFDNYIVESGWDIDRFDTLVLDTQGNEFDVLRGMGDYIKNFKYLNIELSETPLYDGGVAAQEVIDWLGERGFMQDSPIEPHNDVFFIRSDIKSESDQVYRGLA